jgi:hypothetical protein
MKSKENLKPRAISSRADLLVSPLVKQIQKLEKRASHADYILCKIMAAIKDGSMFQDIEVLKWANRNYKKYLKED